MVAEVLSTAAAVSNLATDVEETHTARPAR
jgi:hypothetical protein